MRFGSYMASQYIVLLAMSGLGTSPLDYGLLISLQMIASISSYLPAAKAVDIYGRSPFIAATFTFFPLYTLALGLTPSKEFLPTAFFLAGLREAGEPTIGLYYTVRETIGIAAPLLGALLWSLHPRLTFLTGSAVSAVGLAVYLASRL